MTDFVALRVLVPDNHGKADGDGIVRIVDDRVGLLGFLSLGLEGLLQR